MPATQVVQFVFGAFEGQASQDRLSAETTMSCFVSRSRKLWETSESVQQIIVLIGYPISKLGQVTSLAPACGQ